MLNIRKLISKEQANTRFIELNKTYFKVENHWFWKEYDKTGWEPLTYNVFKHFFTPETTYVDIGTWVGMTIFFAAEIGYRKIYGVEANPESYEIVRKNCLYNKSTENAKISNFCVCNIDDTEIGFAGKIKEGTSSASRISNNSSRDWTVFSQKISTFLRKNNLLDEKLLIKIDIEGAEELIIDDIQSLTDKTIFLACHPPFFSDLSESVDRLVDVCGKWKYVLDSSLNPLSLSELKYRLLSNEKNPSWGTSFGNFFEIVLTDDFSVS